MSIRLVNSETEEAVERLKKEFRAEVAEIYERYIGLGHVAISEVLVNMAFVQRDLQGSGIGDIQHAAKCLHDIVDRIEKDEIEGVRAFENGDFVEDVETDA